MFKVVVPVYPHVKKFILFHYEGEPIPISTRTQIGINLFSLLSKNMDHHTAAFQMPVDQLTFAINEFNYNYSGSELSPVKVLMFNNLMEDIFWQQFFVSVELAINVRPGFREFKKRNDVVESPVRDWKRHYRRKVEIREKTPEIRECLATFLRMYNMDEKDVSLDAAKKAYWRYRKNREKNKKHSKIFY